MGRAKTVVLAATFAAVLLVAGFTQVAAPGVAQAATAKFAWSRPEPLIRFGDRAVTSQDADISCPSVKFCAVGSGQYVWTSTDPTVGKSWKERRVEPASMPAPKNQPIPNLPTEMPNLSTIGQLSCTSASFCLAVDTDDLLISANPTGGNSTWRSENLTANWSVSACAGRGLCVLAGSELSGPQGAADAGIAISSDPSTATPTWDAIGVPTEELVCGEEQTYPCASQFTALSCPSTRFCVAIDSYGQVITTADPTDGASWHASQLLPPNPEGNGSGDLLLSCSSQHFCATWVDGKVLASTDPTGGAGTWHSVVLNNPFIGELTCPSDQLCVALDDGGNFYFSTNPGSQHPTWKHQRVDAAALSQTPHQEQTNYSVSCPTARLCLMTDLNGNVLIGRLATPRPSP
jgi:hypothetical protein